ncbi:MAG: hypothetical protein [Betabaculovirus sp.]|nr:MAG: hypothetical protein [Betabaculovirus sp.]
MCVNSYAVYCCGYTSLKCLLRIICKTSKFRLFKVGTVVTSMVLLVSITATDTGVMLFCKTEPVDENMKGVVVVVVVLVFIFSISPLTLSTLLLILLLLLVLLLMFSSFLLGLLENILIMDAKLLRLLFLFFLSPPTSYTLVEGSSESDFNNKLSVSAINDTLCNGRVQCYLNLRAVR